MALTKDANSVSKVKGPVRCHKCRLTCRDANHYLSHKCEPPRPSLTIARRFKQLGRIE
jgi:hypothetical protein